ncbi:gliding motility protein GldM [Marinifilum sp. N1E240]|uniref:type IX secretion system motor protein PorM/GldM n=1 Tax=Marinifilum sp. N1E240 TaxID=2608082 RepID=UPI00128BFA88|nr:gliding motility protein GldM [Marinifilum sp. N1E240]MPQ48062.1 gliding motility protein GldM [Marinifilum sp. N1E240]
MGATNCKETPRQKMIGMMYLFLTAMLAINVSNEVLDAFTIIDNGLSKTIETFEEKTKATYTKFDMALQANERKVRESWEQAQKIRVQSDSLYAYMQELKERIVEKADGPEYDLNDIKSKDNLDIPPEVMIVGKKGKQLKKAINTYRDLVLANVAVKDSSLRHAILETLNTKDPEKAKPGDPNYSWESKQFSHTPLIGAITLLSKMQVDVRNTESDVVNYLLNQIEAESFKFNDLKAEVIAKSSYVLKGDTYEAEIFLAAVDTTQNPTILINGVGQLSNKSFNKKRRGVFKTKANKLGTHKWGGFLTFKTPSGQDIKREFKAEYTVAEPNVVVSPTKMNVFYVGVDNPVSISAPGFTSDRIRATMTNGKLLQRGNDYIAQPKVAFRDTKVSVEANFDGEWRPLRTVDFRVKPIPDPVAKIAEKSGGKIKRNLLLAQTGVDAVMDNFDFDLEFKITGFTVSAIQKGFTVDQASRSDMFTQDQIGMFRNLKRNQKVYIEDIRAVGPDGVTRNLPAIVFRIE